METILQTPHWSVTASTIAFSITDTDDPDVKEAFSLREVLLPQPLEEFINEMQAAYLAEIREHLGSEHTYYQIVVRYLKLRSWLQGQRDKRSKTSQPPFYVPYLDYYREWVSRTNEREYRRSGKLGLLRVEELEQLVSELAYTFEEDEKRRLARWGLGQVPRLSEDEYENLRRAQGEFWRTFEQIMEGHEARDIDMESTRQRIDVLWRSTREIVIRDQTGQEIPVTNFILDGINDEVLEFFGWAFRRLFVLVSPRLNRAERRWLLFEYTPWPQFAYLMPALSRAIYNFFNLSEEARYLPILVHAFRVKRWHGHDLEARLRELWSTYLTLYAWDRSEFGKAIRRDEERRRKSRRERQQMEVDIESEDALDWLTCEPTASEVEDMVLLRFQAEAIEKLFATEFTLRERQAARLLFEGYGPTDAAQEMGISPQRVSQLAKQIRKKLNDIITGRDDYPSFSGP